MWILSRWTAVSCQRGVVKRDWDGRGAGHNLSGRFRVLEVCRSCRDVQLPFEVPGDGGAQEVEGVNIGVSFSVIGAG